MQRGVGKASPRHRRNGAAGVQREGRGQWGRLDPQSRPEHPEEDRPQVHQVPPEGLSAGWGGGAGAGRGCWRNLEGSSSPCRRAQDPACSTSPGPTEALTQGGDRDLQELQGKWGCVQMQAHRLQGQGRKGHSEGSSRGRGPGGDCDTDRPSPHRTASTLHQT